MSVFLFQHSCTVSNTSGTENLLVSSNMHDMIDISVTVMTLSFRTDRFGQTVQTQIRLLLEEQSDLGLHCLPFHLHLFDEIL